MTGKVADHRRCLRLTLANLTWRWLGRHLASKSAGKWQRTRWRSCKCQSRPSSRWKTSASWALSRLANDSLLSNVTSNSRKQHHGRWTASLTSRLNSNSTIKVNKPLARSQTTSTQWVLRKAAAPFVSTALSSRSSKISRKWWECTYWNHQDRPLFLAMSDFSSLKTIIGALSIKRQKRQILCLMLWTVVSRDSSRVTILKA